ncbi:MAG TPA: glycoside hydrolase family 30 beta sandwich domain-containing protein [Solirubrobacteraceae bacterium]
MGLALLAAVLWVGWLDATGRGFAQTTDPYRVSVVQTSADLSEHLTPLPALEFGSAKAAQGTVIRVNAGTRYQHVQGFGASMTDSSAWLIERDLSPAAGQSLMAGLFGAGGIRLNFVRVPIGASDFTHTGQPYTYDDMPAGQSDPGLRHFSIAHDQAYILPALLEAKALNPATEFLATPWSPPAWMKSNKSLGNAGNSGTLLPSDYGPWAAYIVKFIQAYAHAGIPIDAVTPQNEPGVATLYPGLNISAANEAAWVMHNLKPALARAKVHTSIFGSDLGWGPTTTYASATASGSVARALAGLAWHCYFGSPAVMSQIRHADPALEGIVDECSPGLSPTPISEIVISSLRNWASTVAVWNVALDPKGGPAQLPNHGCRGCSALATIDPATGTVALKASYYQLGQASAFVAPGAQRIASGNFVGYRYPGPGVNVVTPGLDDVALRNPDGSLVLLAYNNSSGPIRFAVAWKGRAFSYQLSPGATVTFSWNQP